MKLAVINGAYGGIGSAICKKLNKEGYSLVLLGRKKESLNKLKNELPIKDSTQFVDSYIIEATDSEGFKGVANDVFIKHGKVDALINACGSLPIGNIVDLTANDWQHGFECSFMSAVNFVSGFYKDLCKQKHGQIIIINGILSIQPDHNMIIGSSITGALRNFAKALSKDLGEFGVRVNTINPGVTNTGLWDQISNVLSSKFNCTKDELTKTVTSQTPLGRIAEADDIANMVKLLCSDESRFVNGATITIDGGSLAAIG